MVVRIYGRFKTPGLDWAAEAPKVPALFGEALADAFNEIERRTFAAQGAGPFGEGPWKPLTPAYAAWKATHYPGKPILRRTDRMYKALTGERISNMTFAGNSVTLRVPSLAAYWRFHQDGTPKMDRRPPVPTAGVERIWGRVWLDFLVHGTRGGFAGGGVGSLRNATVVIV